MLEGEVVHLPAPKTHFTQDIELVKDTPIFCTSKRPLIYIKNGVVDDRESEMMAGISYISTTKSPKNNGRFQPVADALRNYCQPTYKCR